MICKVNMNLSKNIRTEMYPLIINLLKSTCQIQLVSFLISQVIECPPKILRRMYSLSYLSILRNFSSNQHFRPICTELISIQPTPGLKEIDGKTYCISTKRQITLKEILQFKMSGQEKNYGMQSLNYQRNSGLL